MLRKQIKNILDVHFHFRQNLVDIKSMGSLQVIKQNIQRVLLKLVNLFFNRIAIKLYEVNDEVDIFNGLNINLAE